MTEEEKSPLRLEFELQQKAKTRLLVAQARKAELEVKKLELEFGLKE